MAYAVVRTDNLSGIVDGAKLVTVQIGETPVQNGTIVVLDKYNAAPVREAWAYKAAGATATADGKTVLIATPELLYDKKYNALDEFTNEANTLARGYVLEAGDTFSVTKEAFSGATLPAVGNKINAGATLAVNASGVFAEVIAKETVGSKEFAVLRVL